MLQVDFKVVSVLNRLKVQQALQEFGFPIWSALWPRWPHWTSTAPWVTGAAEKLVSATPGVGFWSIPQMVTWSW